MDTALAMPRLADLQRPAVVSNRGIAMVRALSALYLAKNDALGALNIASAKMEKGEWRDTPQVVSHLRAAVDAGTTSDATWAQPLVESSTLASEFVAYLQPQTILGRLAQFARRVPFATRVPRQTSGASAGWVGEGAPVPVSESAFDSINLGYSKIGGLCIVSNELLKLSSPAAEQIIRADLSGEIVRFSDAAFASTAPAVANVSPAGILAGLTPITSAGSSIANVITDAQAAIAQIIAGGGQLIAPFWIMTQTTAAAIAGKYSGNVAAFPTMSVAGGSLLGIPVITSASIGGSVSGGSRLILVDAAEILVADDAQADISLSGQASVQMDSAPAAGAQTLVSLWANNLTGIKALRYVNWLPRRASGYAAFVDFVSY